MRRVSICASVCKVFLTKTLCAFGETMRQQDKAMKRGKIRGFKVAHKAKVAVEVYSATSTQVKCKITLKYPHTTS